VKILLIEDSRFQRIANGRALVKAGHDVIHAGDGDGGLMNVHADILFMTHKDIPIRSVGMRRLTTYRKSARLFILRVIDSITTSVRYPSKLGDAKRRDGGQSNTERASGK
jgi:hypothetical protein